MPLARFAEVYQSMLDGRMPPYLLATPTRVNGLLDAEALVERVAGYERDGVQALLAGPAGRRCCGWAAAAVTADAGCGGLAAARHPGRAPVHRWPHRPALPIRGGAALDDT
ncbi:hypothetical protein [Nonomuraea rubra]|uniref:hypothetical protein n=1 Tax=Nonomuraea rubra TaxID=46180 RepID=UPI0031EF1200